jgi:hypothetical protein
MIPELIFITSYISLYPDIIHPRQSLFSTPPTETFCVCHVFEISDPCEFLPEDEYIEDILNNSFEDTDCSVYKIKPFDIFQNMVDDYIGHCYQVDGQTNYCKVLRR